MKRIWVDPEKCLGCKTCELRCAVERDSQTKTFYGAVHEQPRPVSRVGVFGPTGKSFPLQCRQCEDAPCLKACPSGAMQRDLEKHTIYVEGERCRGCWMCVMSCPMGVIMPTGYKVAMKCDACMNMESPACVASCPTGALICGDETDYRKVLSERSGHVALFARGRKDGENAIVSLEYVREGL
jgi:carbon-monoxide dehydrogenase iron sulfur subunit